MSDWPEMKTVPKDGIEILAGVAVRWEICHPASIENRRLNGYPTAGWQPTAMSYPDFDPDLWQPLPELPEQARS